MYNVHNIFHYYSLARAMKMFIGLLNLHCIYIVLIIFRKIWLCPNCNNSYDNMLIEHSLIDTLGRKVMAYTLQDLQCTKCSEVCI